MEELTLEKFEEAAGIVSKVTQETRLIFSEHYSNLSGNQIYFKPENLQYTGSFKVRGACYKISTLSEEEKNRGVITASSGNHAQAVAYAARCFGTEATVVMPVTTPLIKVNRTKRFGAQVILQGETSDDAREYACRLAREKEMTYIHPFNDLDVATGHGSIAMEIVKELPTADCILIPMGGGGLCAGIAAFAKMLNPCIRIIGVEPAGANCIQQSLSQGRVVTLPHVNTIADGTAVKTPGDKLLPYIRKNVDDILLIEDSELVMAFMDVMENHKMVVENSGLLTVAALRHLKNVRGQKIVCILSGGNMDMMTMASVVQNGLLLRDRIFTVSVLLPDKPGALANVAHIIGEEQGSIIKLDHNQFINMNRSESVELRITMEAFGPEHKAQIVRTLEEKGYRPRVVNTTATYEM